MSHNKGFKNESQDARRHDEHKEKHPKDDRSKHHDDKHPSKSKSESK